MKPTSILWLCVAFYSLWLLRGISNYGIFHKERKATEQTLIKAHGLIDQLKLTAVHADKIVKDVEADYQVKTKSLPQLLQAVHNLIVTLRYGLMTIIGLVAIGYLVHWYKN